MAVRVVLGAAETKRGGELRERGAQSGCLVICAGTPPSEQVADSFMDSGELGEA